MQNMIIFMLCVIFFKPFSALVYVLMLLFTSLTPILRIKRSITLVDAMIIAISITGSCFAFLNLSHVLETAGVLASIFYITFYWMIIIVVLLDIDFEVVIKHSFNLILKFGIPIIIIATFSLGSSSDTFNGYSTIPELFGIDLHRTFFLFTGGVNHFGIMLGFCLVITSAFKLSIFETVMWWMSALLLVMFIDSRGALLAIIVALIFSKWRFITPYVWMIAPVVMVALGMLLVGVEDFYLSREGSTIFSQREYLWALGISGLSVMSWENLLIGYGVNGFMSNSIASIVSTFFEYRNSIGSLHNAHLTLLYDYGFVGLVLFIFLNLKIILNLKCLSDERRNLSIKCLIFVSITSATETVYSFNYLPILLTFIFITQLRRDSFNERNLE